MVFSVTSEFTVEGDATKTFNTLSNLAVTGSNNLSNLSSTNYVVAGQSTPNPANQAVFKNQPLSWWVSSLNSGAVKYTPVSNDVNWAFVDQNKNAIHISIEVSNLLIPNKTKSITRNPGSMTTLVTFEPKFGVGRVDTQSM